MRSTRHLSITVAMVVGGLVIVGLAAGWLGTHPSPSTTAQHPTTTPTHSLPSSQEPSTSTTQAPATSAGAPPPPPGRAAHDPRPAKVAKSFAKAFTHHPEGMPQRAWVRQVTPHVMPESRGLLSTVDPNAVDVHRVTGPPQMQQAGDSVARVTVPTDAQPLRMLVVNVAGTWQVRSWGGE